MLRRLLPLLAIIAIAAAVGPGSPASATEQCGSHVYIRKTDIVKSKYGNYTGDDCMRVREDLAHNVVVLERALCRLRLYEEWKREAKDDEQKHINDLYQKILSTVPGTLRPGAGGGPNLSSVAGRLSFANNVADVLEAYASLIQALGASQGGSFFTGMIWPVKKEIYESSRWIRKTILWLDYNCPPASSLEEMPDFDPLPPPDGGKKPVPTESGEGKTVRDELEDRFFDRNAHHWKIDFKSQEVPEEAWQILWRHTSPLGLAGFFSGLDRGAFDDRLSRHNRATAQSAYDELKRGIDFTPFLAAEFYEPFEESTYEPHDPGAAPDLLGSTHVGGLTEDQPTHPTLRVFPESRLTGKARYDADGKMKLEVRSGKMHELTTVTGAYWFRAFDVSGGGNERNSEVTRDVILNTYWTEAERLGGQVEFQSQNRLHFSVPAGGTTTWVKVWASAGQYTLEIVNGIAAKRR